jgi:hypothetical protein
MAAHATAIARLNVLIAADKPHAVKAKQHKVKLDRYLSWIGPYCFRY